MFILVTGSKGFIGKNLICELKNKGFIDILECDIDTSNEQLLDYTSKCNFVFNLAGINRPKNEDEFMKGNCGFISTLIDALKKNHNNSPILTTSSIQAELDNPYGASKKAGEKLLEEYGKKEKVKTFIYRLPNVFGKWSRPNYNSAIATFCNNIANDLEIKVNDANPLLRLVYIDDVIKEFLNALNGQAHIDKNGFGYIPEVYEKHLKEIVDLLYSFKSSRKTLSVPKLDDLFQKKLYSTYLSFLPTNKFSYPLKMNVDQRGSFTEIIRTLDCGQFSVNISKPGITKGNHWHHTKCEKFVVVSGKGLIQFRKINTDEVIEYFVSGDKIEVVDIPTGYTHNIINVGDSDLVTFMWCNECFDKENPDTYYEEV